MPYDLIKRETYDFNFDSLISMFKSKLTDERLYQYLYSWNKVLIKLDNETCISSEKFKKNPEILSMYLLSNEFFQFPFTFFDNQKYIFEFNITNITQNMNLRNAKTKEIPLTNFTVLGNKNDYQYTHYSNVTAKYLNNNPIIIVPFPDGYTTGVVIDGNHRLSAYVKYRKNSIKAINLCPYGVFQFGTPIDMGMYLFYNELQSILIRLSYGENLEKLLDKSFLKTQFSNYLP